MGYRNSQLPSTSNKIKLSKNLKGYTAKWCTRYCHFSAGRNRLSRAIAQVRTYLGTCIKWRKSRSRCYRVFLDGRKHYLVTWRSELPFIEISFARDYFENRKTIIMPEE